MSSDASAAHYRVPAEERLNVFALVIYIPGPLGDFLDDLRRELVPSYDPHAHVSVLPPRPLAVEWQYASAQIKTLTEGRAPFDVELTRIGVFPVTDVIYIEVGAGASELRRMHQAMNFSSMEFQEPFSYHPHSTLAQGLPHDGVQAANELAVRRWAEFRGSRTFRAEQAVFVQSTLRNCWIDLAEYSLGAVAANI